MNTHDYVNQVNTTIKNIDEFTEEQHHKTCLLLQNAGLSVPRVTTTDTGVSVSLRSATAKKTVIFSVKKVGDKQWADMPCSRAFFEYAKGVAQDDFETFGANMRSQLVNGKRESSGVGTELEKAWQDAFNASQESVGDKDTLETQARVIHQRHIIPMAWSSVMYRMFSELFLAAMEDGQDDGMTLLYGHRAKVMYTHTEGNLLVLRQTFGDSVEIKTVVLDL